jgi:type 2 lantibiotic biosynthesis protein LanM
MENRPRLAGGDVPFLDHAGEVETGFEQMMRLLLAHREELLEMTGPLAGPLASSAEAEVRVIARPTQTYARVLQESFHPFVLRDALDRDRLRDRLWVGVEERPSLASLIPFEFADLEQADIPLFTTRPGSRDLWSSGGRRIPGILSESGLERTARRLRAFSEESLAHQLQVIRGTFTAAGLSPDRRWPAYRFRAAGEEPAASRLLAAARAVGDRLAALAFRHLSSYHQGSASWFGLTMIGESSAWDYRPVGYDLYSGLSGIALFLGHLAAATGEDRYGRLAREALATVRGRLKRDGALPLSIGGYTGFGGIAYTLLRLGSLWQEVEMVTAACDLVDLLPERIDEDRQLDVLGGSAGCLLALLRLHRVRPGEPLLAAARRCGERLLAQARPMEHGLGWTLEQAGPHPLLGLSHGAAGIGWALLELATATGDERFREAGRAAIAYERSLFSPADGNWPDLRELGAPGEGSHGAAERFTCAWCHGAPGIGLARLASLPHLDDGALRAEIDTAIATTLRHGFGKNHSLCHGDLGNLDFLLEAGRRLDDPGLRAQAGRLAGGVLDSFAPSGWLCGSPTGVESPGLLTGLAGIGYQLLRLADPERVPSVLLLGDVISP